MPWPKIVYEDIAVDGAEKTTVSVSDKLPFSNPSKILEEEPDLPYIATMEMNYWGLDGSSGILPADPVGSDWGWISEVMCDANGDFATPPVLTFNLLGYFTSVGLTFSFDPYEPAWPTRMRVDWYRDAELLESQEFSPTAVQYSALKTVRLFNKVVVTFLSMSEGCRRLRVSKSLYGIIRTFGKDEYSSVQFYQTLSLIADELEISDLVFDVRNLSTVPFNFQRRQQLSVYHGDRLLGIRFITKSVASAGEYYKLTAQDFLGIIIDSEDHNGGVYNGETVAMVLEDILGGIVPYTIDEELRDIPLKGWLPIASRLDNLTRVLFAIGATVSTAGVKEMRIFRAALPGEVVPVSLAGRSVTDPQMVTEKAVTGVQITEHSFTVGTETVEEYNGILDGETTVTFADPVYNLTITGGTIVEWGANYAVIRGTGGAVVLTGFKYNHSTRLLTKNNPYIESGTLPNVKKCQDSYLVGPHNSAEVLERYYNYHMRNGYVTTAFEVIDDRPGDVVQLENDFHGPKVGNLIYLDMTLSKTLVADAKVLLEYEEV